MISAYFSIVALILLPSIESRCDEPDCRHGNTRLVRELEEATSRRIAETEPTLPELKPISKQMLPFPFPSSPPPTIAPISQPNSSSDASLPPVAPTTLPTSTTTSTNSTFETPALEPRLNSKANIILTEFPTSYIVLWAGVGALTVVAIVGIYIGCRRMKRIPPPPSMEPPEAHWESDYNGGYDRI